MYKNRIFKDRHTDSRLKFGPLWDYDLAFGNAIFQDGYKTDGWQFEINTRLYITHLLADTVLKNALVNRWFELRKTSFNTDTLLDLIDSLVTYIKDARIRNYNHWPVISQMIFGTNPLKYAKTYDEDIQLMKEWLLERLDWIDNNISKIYYPMPKPLGIEDNDINITENIFTVYPNPFSDNFTIDMKLAKPGKFTLVVSDLNGRLVYITTENISESGTYSITIHPQLQNGLYILSILSEEKCIYSGKLIKQ